MLNSERVTFTRIKSGSQSQKSSVRMWYCNPLCFLVAAFGRQPWSQPRSIQYSSHTCLAWAARGEVSWAYGLFCWRRRDQKWGMWLWGVKVLSAKLPDPTLVLPALSYDGSNAMPDLEFWKWSFCGFHAHTFSAQMRTCTIACMHACMHHAHVSSWIGFINSLFYSPL